MLSDEERIDSFKKSIEIRFDNPELLGGGSQQDINSNYFNVSFLLPMKYENENEIEANRFLEPYSSDILTDIKNNEEISNRNKPYHIYKVEVTPFPKEKLTKVTYYGKFAEDNVEANYQFRGKTSIEELLRMKISTVVHCKGHKNSSGELAEWCIKSESTGKILSSHKSKDQAVSHLRDIEGHKEK